MNINKVLAVTLLASAVSLSWHDSNANVKGNNVKAIPLSIIGEHKFVEGHVDIIQPGARLIVRSIRTVGDNLILSFDDTAAAKHATIKLSAKALKNTKLDVGNSIDVIKVPVGLMLESSDEAIALLPNAKGYELILSMQSK